MRVASLLIAASSVLLGLGASQHPTTPRGQAVAPTAAGIPRFPPRAAQPPSAPSALDSLRLRVRPLDPSGKRECPMPVASRDAESSFPAPIQVRPEPVPAPMPVAPSACVNPLGR